jgi:sulfite reductase (NADPH) hemoprotein beta-component
LKRAGIAPGDVTTEEMNLIADLADKYTFGEFRTTHEQNISLVDVPQKDLFELWQTLNKQYGTCTYWFYYRYYLLSRR